MSEIKAYGVDVSHRQDPSVVPYSEVSFVIVKATEGASFRDPMCMQHIARAREAGATVGLYHYYRYGPDHNAQIVNFLRTAKDVGLGPDDIVPCLDIEQGPYSYLPSNAWNHPCEAIAKAFEASYGGCMVYLNKRDFHLMLSPDWVAARPLWFAQYNDEMHAPFPPVVWQHRVGPFEVDGPGGLFEPRTIDQNVLLEDMPLIQASASDILTKVYSAEYQEILAKLAEPTEAIKKA